MATELFWKDAGPGIPIDKEAESEASGVLAGKCTKPGP